ncbi:ferredoxin domain-containing protein [Thermodesulfitimonas sp.]
MALAAKTAPKSLGQDYLVTRTLTGEAVGRLADAMVAYGRETGKKDFDRDGENIRRAAAVFLIGLKEAKPLGLNCGACGFARCEDAAPREGPEFRGPQCFWRAMDMGIALGSAVKTASLFNVDNRVMRRVGVVARRLGLIDADVVLGVPLAATGKNIFFDRALKKE